ncbi:MAG: hypothetical protein HY904_14690 [Deltaproteobacteria bacterium]|nr:hypothetical protein [Deltaproteobacteria bacterium]
MHPPAQAACAVLVGITLAVHGYARRRQGRRVVPGQLPWVLAAGALWSILQAVPLPMGLLRLLSPQAAELHEFMTWDGTAAWGAISVEPLSTLVAAGQLLTCAAFLTVCNDLARQERNRPWLVSLVGLSAAVGVLAGVAQYVFGWKRLLDVVTTPYWPPYVAPFVNPNHAVAFMNLGILVSVALVLHARTLRVRAAWLAVALACAVRIPKNQSHGGNVALVAGLVGIALVSWPAVMAWNLRRRQDNPRAIPLSPFAALVAAAGIAAVVAALDFTRLAAAMHHALGGKVALMAQSVRPLEFYWLTGMGRGAFSQVFPRHMTVDVNLTVVGPENIEVLLAVEWGLPFALLYMAAFAYPVLRQLRRNHGLLERVCLVAVLATFLHNQIDFNLELLGIALPFLALVAAAGATLPQRRPRQRSHTSSTAAMVGGVAVALVVSLPALASVRAATEPSRARALARPLPERVAALEEHLRGHRTDYVAALALARILHATQPEDGARRLAWINRAMFLRPHYVEGHLDAAAALWDLDRTDQALIEYGHAARAHEAPRARILGELRRRGASVEQLRAVFGRENTWVCQELWRGQEAGMATRCVAQVRRDNPADPALQRLLADLTLHLLDDPWEAESLAQRALELAPEDPRSMYVLAAALEANGKADQAAPLLRRASERSGDADIQRAAFKNALARGAREEALAALGRLQNALAAESKPMLEVMMGEAQLEESSGNTDAAIRAYRDAARANPKDPRPALAAARLAAARGNARLAVLILQQAYSLSPNPVYSKKIEELQH